MLQDLSQHVQAPPPAMASDALPPLPLPGTDQLRARQRRRQRLALFMLAAVCVFGLFALLRVTPQDSLADEPITKVGGPSTPLFQNWGDPALAIVISGQQYGYLQPCGCSRPQYGGLARRYNFVQILKKTKNWPVVAVDLGDVAQKKPNPHQNLKYKYAMKSLDAIGYSAIGVGQAEMAMPLIESIAAYSLNNPTPQLVSATLVHPDTDQVIRLHLKPTVVARSDKANAPTLGVSSLIGPSVLNNVNDPDLGFQDNVKTVLSELDKLGKAKVPMTMLLYQGTVEEAKLLAQFCAGKRKDMPGLPALDLILCLSAEDEPPSVPTTLPGVPTQIFQIGHKGRYVGVIGAFPAGKGYQFRYQLVSVGPQYDTPEGQEKGHKVMDLMSQYAREVFEEKLITKFPTSMHPVQASFPKAEYVGSERCKKCHAEEHQIWKTVDAHGHGHSRAFQTLVDVKHPPLRQHDGECVVCHTVGFSHPTGYADALRSGDEDRIKILKDVGCESCHGPASAHTKDTGNKEIHKVMNPWKYSGEHRLKNINMFCQKCHDIDNDVHWNFDKKWPKIVHNAKPVAAPAKLPVGAPAKTQPQPAAAPLLDPPGADPEPINIPVPQQPTTNPMANPPGERDGKIFPKLFKKIRKD